MILYIIGFGLFVSQYFNRQSSHSDKDVIAGKIFHAHMAANMLEDEIRKIRIEDHPIRTRYNEIKESFKGNKSENNDVASEDEE